MRNPWLDRVKMTTLENLVANYKANYTLTTLEPLFEAFNILAEKIINSVKDKAFFKSIKDQEDKMIRRMFFAAIIKIGRYDPTKGKAHNYFMTIMLSELRQICGTSRNYKQLKEKYYKWLCQAFPDKH
jgi:hypothetical protein